jgi:hypothetical protein
MAADGTWLLADAVALRMKRSLSSLRSRSIDV